MSVRSKPIRDREPESDGSELPEGWAVAVLSSLCDRQRGVSYGRDDARSEPAKGLIPILRANNIEGDKLNFNDLVFVGRECVSENQQLNHPMKFINLTHCVTTPVRNTTRSVQKEWTQMMSSS